MVEKLRSISRLKYGDIVTISFYDDSETISYIEIPVSTVKYALDKYIENCKFIEGKKITPLPSESLN